MKKFGFFVILIILLIFTSACSNSSTDSAEMKNEGIFSVGYMQIFIPLIYRIKCKR